MTVYNFRVDQSKLEVQLERLKNDHFISMGWGGGQNSKFSLNDGYKEFRKRFFQKYQDSSVRRVNNIWRITYFKDNDILVIPHMPDYDHFMIMKVSGDFPKCYSFDKEDENDTHLNNRIYVKDIRGLNGELNISNEFIISWRSKLAWMRLPVYPLRNYEDLFLNLFEILSDKDRKSLSESSLDTILTKSMKDPLDKFINCFAKEIQVNCSNTGSLSFEKVCEMIVNYYGYQVRSKNHFDREGGDADLICIKDKSLLSPFEQNEDVLYVQVKKHEGITDEGAVRQLSQIMNTDQDNNAVGFVMSLCDDFTESAKNLALSENIGLMSKKEICTILLQILAPNY